jgi:imidazolonepropionase-like amidohydrolase
MITGTILKNVNLVDVIHGQVEEVHVVIEDDRIAEIGSRLPDKHNELYQVVDLDGHFAVPGLIDLHTHLIWSGGNDPEKMVEEDGFQVSLLRAAVNAFHTLEKGITCVRDLGSHRNATIALSRAIERNYVVGPRVIPAGCSIIMTGGHDPFWGIQADGSAELVKAVRAQFERGARVIKISATGGVYGRVEGEDVGTVELNRDEIEAVCTEAHKFGLKVAAHAISEEGIWNCIKAGVDTIEHGHFLNEDAMREMKNRNIFWIPTIFVYQQIAEGKNLPEYAVAKSRKIINVHRSAFIQALKVGVPLAAGSDAGSPNTPHGSLLDELSCMVAYGSNAREALKAATISAACALGLDRDIGSLEVGKKADIFIVEQDPTANIESLRSPVHVFKDGKLIA